MDTNQHEYNFLTEDNEGLVGAAPYPREEKNA
jgi:hypothetical protein